MNVFLHIPPPVYAALLLGLCKGLDDLFPLPFDISVPALGVALTGSGMALMFWAWLHFYRNKTTPIPTREPSTLVEEGPYRLTRNPMYLGLLLVLAGVVFFVGAPVYLLAPVGFLLIVDQLFIPYEEAKLERLFGPDFARWKQKIRRWL